MIFDLMFAGDPLKATDVSGGTTTIVVDAAAPQQAVLRSPRRGPAAGQEALYLDGWTTWVERRGRAREDVNVRLSTWFAPRAIAGGDARGFTALIDATDGAGGVALGHSCTGHVAGAVAGELFVGELRLERDRWHYLELLVLDGAVHLYLDGRPAGVWATAVAAVTVPPVILVGRSADAPRIAGVVRTAVANGALARATVEMISSDVTDSNFPGPPDTAVVGGDVDTDPDRSRYGADPYRPIAHVTAAQGWMNEPHAAIQIGGVHHIFWQHNPTGPYWGDIAWGHAVSTDLAHWRDEPMALAPADTTVAPHGIWSGSSVRGAGGEHLLFFTAGDMSRSPDQSIAVARPRGRGWDADRHAVLSMPDSVPGRREPLIPGQFRDPFVWREGERWFLTVGAGLSGVGGVALLFASSDGTRWEQRPPLLVGDVSAFPATGVMWELPVLLPIGVGVDGRARHALFVAPWWAGPNEHHLQHVWHWVGVWDAAAGVFEPDHDEPREFDGGGHLTGPSGTVLEDGRAVLWSITQDKRSMTELADSGWAHNAGWPLQLGLHADGEIGVKPVAELASLRRERREPGADHDLARGRHLDIELDVVGGGFEIDVLRSADGREATVLGVSDTAVWVDRTRSSLADEHTEARRSLARRRRPAVHARIVIDGSMIEMYIDDRVSMTTRAYPVSGDADGVRLRLAPAARVERLEIHVLGHAFDRAAEGAAAPSSMPPVAREEPRRVR
ncbi:glycoside hydrolase family 32 protein [Microbacterium oleivorans]|uniref:beta-fructofuranosidase n=1 Tax=Microbacterium oleivorans TaxID=273677 RepID=A0A7D5ISI0_9MICO|nr:glycoside hydrolase family 32 protein [Microbacterium oleivorans]QLD11617.1 glycoside hydrolase family 32 protein [Microbacterium oleivorans]